MYLEPDAESKSGPGSNSDLISEKYYVLLFNSVLLSFPYPQKTPCLAVYEPDPIHSQQQQQYGTFLAKASTMAMYVLAKTSNLDSVKNFKAPSGSSELK